MMTLQEASVALRGRASAPDVRFTGVSTDSRTLRPGELFVALRGDRFDGHAFLSAAAAARAAGALVDRGYAGEAPLPCVVVDDTRIALGTLARHWRKQFSPALIAVTGSNGKTTVKEMIFAILRRHAGEAAVLATAGNLNNDIGVPLTVLRMREAHRWCVVELGMNHRGEIDYLAHIAQPTVALVNNAQREHLEFLRTVDDVAAENSAVFDALAASGIAVVNADDAHARFFRRRAGGRRVLDFGVEQPAAVTARFELGPLGTRLALRTPEGEADAALSIPGLHNVRNALAAAACALAVGIPLETIAAGLGAFRPYVGRLQVKELRGATVIDDTYNANPDSVRAAIDVLASCPGPTVLVLGDMGEVGERGQEFHREVGSYARSKGISALLGLGDATRHAVQAFGSGGRHFEDVESLVASVQGRSVLVKGSRFMRMERVVAALAGTPVGEAH